MLEHLQPLLHGHPVCDEVDHAVLRSLSRQGLLTEALGHTDLSDCRVALESDTQVGNLLAEMLEAHVDVAIGVLDSQMIEGADLVIACAGWLPDRSWRQIDELCIDTGVPWHRCYSEGRSWALGPMTLPGRTASYVDTQARILAAARNPDEVKTYWDYLGSTAFLPPVPSVPAGAAMIIAGFLLADTLALLRGDEIPSLGHQIVINVDTLTVERHPVLPLPPVWTASSQESGAS